jgi:alpha-D-xyloside xylohydrolase
MFMKFTNGYWLIKEEIEPHYAAFALDAEQKDNELVVYAPDKTVKSRGDTLNIALLTVRYSSPLKNVIKVRVSHFDGGVDRGPCFETMSDPALKPEVVIVGGGVTGEAGEASFVTGDLSVRIALGTPWKAVFHGKDKVLTACESKSTAYMINRKGKTASAAGERSFTDFPFDSSDDSGWNFVKEELSLGVGEYVYGLGERFGPFIKNGQTVEIWNADGGTASDQAYKSIPFYMTNKGYGVLVNNTGKVSFEVASEKTSRVQFSVAGEVLEYYLIYGPNPKQILERYTALTGRPALPPEWSYGLWLSTSFTTSYDEKTVMSFIDGMQNRRIPLQVFHFDCFWMQGFHWCDFVWDKATFPDPAGMIARIKAKGLKVSLWINPYIAQRSTLFEEGRSKGYFLKNRDGSVWQTDHWQAGLAIVDFTNPEATQWYTSCLARLLDMGVDCFKTDFGERIPTNVVYHDGGNPNRYHNYYTYLYNKAVFEFLEQKKGKGQALLFARSATVGSQQFPLHWGGDCESTFEAMAETLRGGLSLGLSGFGFWSHDIGGFEGTPNAALFKRWLAFGLLSSHSRLHGSNSYRVPWNVDEESVDVCKFFAELKRSLTPYLVKCAYDAHEQGIPVLRAMLLEYPDDPVCPFLDRQYMLGDSLLVVPVFSESGTVEYYLPPGTWTHFIDKINGSARREQGGKWIREVCDFMSIPLWIREGYSEKVR